MADNFLGNRMDDYLAGRLNRPAAPRRLTPSGAKPGMLALPLNPRLRVWIADGALSPAGIALIRLLTSTGVHVYYRAEAGKRGAEPAIKFGARHFPPEVPDPEADATFSISPSQITLNSAAIISFPSDKSDLSDKSDQSDRSEKAAQLAAALLAAGPSYAKINL